MTDYTLVEIDPALSHMFTDGGFFKTRGGVEESLTKGHQGPQLGQQ